MSKEILRTTLRVTDDFQGKRVKQMLKRDIGMSQNARLIEDVYFAEALREKYPGKSIIEILLMFIDLEIKEKEDILNKPVELHKPKDEKVVDTNKVLGMLDNLVGVNNDIK